ncbi:DUF4123 domain-containing protein [Cronobacter malonaticus]
MITNYYRENCLTLSEHQYMVIDRMNTGKIPDTLPVIELTTPLTAGQAHLYPWLLPLNDLSTSDWNWLESRYRQSQVTKEQPPGCLLLTGSQPSEIVRHHLTNALFISDQQQNKHVLRYYDPRVLFHLIWMMDAWSLANLLAVRDIPDWTFWLDGQWHTLSFIADQRPEAGRTNSTQLFSSLQRIGLINNVLTRLPEIDDLTQRERQSKIIFQLLEAGENWLKNPDDLSEFALSGVKYGMNFYLSEPVQSLLKESEKQPGTYCQVARSWNREKWSAVMNETTHTMPKGFSL